MGVTQFRSINYGRKKFYGNGSSSDSSFFVLNWGKFFKTFCVVTYGGAEIEWPVQIDPIRPEPIPVEPYPPTLDKGWKRQTVSLIWPVCKLRIRKVLQPWPLRP